MLASKDARSQAAQQQCRCLSGFIILGEETYGKGRRDYILYFTFVGAVTIVFGDHGKQTRRRCWASALTFHWVLHETARPVRSRPIAESMPSSQGANVRWPFSAFESLRHEGGLVGQ
jgi:hypothetical protein